MIGHGVCSFSSHSAAAGRITSAAKPWTQSRMSFWSWLSASENVTSWPAAPEIASTAASAASVVAGVARSDVADADIGGFSWGRRRGRGSSSVGTARGRELLELDADYPALSRAKPARRRGTPYHSQGPEGTRHKACL